MVVDTDVLIDDLRDQADAVAFLEGCTQPLVQSVVSVAELYVGVREGEERRRLDGFAALPLEREAVVQAGLWRRRSGPSHGTGLADALVPYTKL